MSKSEVDATGRKKQKIRRAGGSARPGIGFVKYRLASYPLNHERSEYFSCFIAESWPMSFAARLFS
ncbi:hypothetical protein [Sinorhizobium terangae]|uniref:hypothetical protein n=1 Tax=Sinorhizobium terangae TaxID=110322 RepID=UPI0024B0D2F0|nr:hypothetical protein [Sinorhizobium terangae]WFU50705.1 hypothetical protein QA637_18860 [Sinorhizobium terangae]